MKRKVTLKVFTPLLHEVESKLDALHMRRDSFLNHLINRELPHLESDLQGKRLSISIRRSIAHSLKSLGCSHINVQLDFSTAERLDKVTGQANIVRDSFINRLLYFSLSSDSLLQFFEVAATPVAYQHSGSIGYFSSMHEIQVDPLATLRKFVAVRHRVGLYAVSLPIKLAAFECYLEDEVFWNKYSSQSNSKESTREVLQSFESIIYEPSFNPVR